MYICQNPSILILHLVIFGGERGQVGEKEGKGWMIVKMYALPDGLIDFSKRVGVFCKGHPSPKIDRSSTGILSQTLWWLQEKKTALTALSDNILLRQ